MKRMVGISPALAAAIAVIFPFAALAEAISSDSTPPGQKANLIVSTPHDRQKLNLTLYQGGLALIQDGRSVDLKAGVQNIHFQGVTPEIIADSTLLDGSGFTVRERTYTYDLISLEALLKANTGKTIQLQLNGRYFGSSTGPYFVTAKLLTVQNGRILISTQIPGTEHERILALSLDDYADMISFNHIPDNLSESPALSIQVESDINGRTPVALTYLSNGFGWDASYVADLVSDQTLNLDAWVTLRNNTSVPLNKARIQLLAGEVSRAAPMYKHNRMESDNAPMMAMSAAPAGGMENLGDYKLFTLPGEIDLSARQSKQVNLFSHEQVSIEKSYTLPIDLSHNTKQLKADIRLKLTNTEESGLGTPMPAGIMRFYQPDTSGLRQFIGEVRIPDLDKHQEHTALIGRAFGLSANNKTIRWDKAGWLQGELELINSQDTAMTADILLQPLLYRKDNDYKRIPLCQTSENQEITLRLSLRPAGGEADIVHVSQEGNGVCKVSVKLKPDTKASYHYEYRINPAG
ncbi:DUF4139 domain-containing protein [Oceanospirillum sediminis]|uniref:DUF4139 domain-containing protein n=1 Tax=Oceanospirillum sediminis TaxID=2760088 RepID=A0A839IMV4_9GAMM|nr:hypothetical protein [Oceanospirillum sediminis]MBB1485842.1 hypothetical protein [Oceanospirillum sediminis]